MSASVLYDQPGPRARRLSRILSIVFAVAFAALIAGGVYQLWLGGAFYADRWDIFFNAEYWTARRGLLLGLRNTLMTAAIASVLAIIIGIAFAIGRSARSRWVRIPVTILLEFFRGMPVLLMILFVLLAMRFGPIESVIAALAVYNGAIIGEAIRTGVAALPKGQRESGLAIGLSPMRTL
ncbi:MAG: ABC transporter permease subunit, partial [Agrococcus sp.]